MLSGLSLLWVSIVACSRLFEVCGFSPLSSPASKRALHNRAPAGYTRRCDLLGRPGPFQEEEDSRSGYYDTRLVGDSDAARELREMRYENDDDYYSEDPNEEIEDQSRHEEEVNAEDEYAYYDTREDEDAEDEYSAYYDQDDVENDDTTGNYWSNPKGGLDRYPTESIASSQPRRRKRPPSTAVPHRRPRRNRSGRRSTERTTFRSGTPAPPGALDKFFHRLFWYGFDSDNIASTSDRTVFGGTRGKFHGLEYLKAIENEPFATPYRQRRSPRRSPDQGGYNVEFFEDLEDLDDEAYEPSKSTRRSIRSEDDWVSDEVSSWFLPGVDRRSDKQMRREKKGPWNVVGQLFNLEDDEDMSYQAEMYNRRLKGRGRVERGRPRGNGETRETGYGYPYVAGDSPTSVVDVEVDDVDTGTTEAIADSPPVEDSVGDDDTEDSVERPERSWIDRAQAVERVPPSGVAAWGPSGDLGIDARTKATLDALEEIQSSKRKLESREKREELARENMVVARADAELQKKRLLANKGTGKASELLRNIEMDVEDAAVALRRAKAQAAAARQQLQALEESHWALLSLYDADKAFREVVETIQQSEKMFDNDNVIARDNMEESNESTT